MCVRVRVRVRVRVCVRVSVLSITCFIVPRISCRIFVLDVFYFSYLFALFVDVIDTCGGEFYVN